MYVRANDEEIAKKAAKALTNAGVEHINWNWSGKDYPNCFEFKVKYFKGHRHWE